MISAIGAIHKDTVAYARKVGERKGQIEVFIGKVGGVDFGVSSGGTVSSVAANKGRAAAMKGMAAALIRSSLRVIISLFFHPGLLSDFVVESSKSGRAAPGSGFLGPAGFEAINAPAKSSVAA